MAKAHDWSSPVAQLVKNLPAMPETPVQFLGQEDPPGEGIEYPLQYSWAFLVAQLVKNLPAKEGDLGLIPGLRRSPGEGSSYSLQCSGLENPVDCIVRWVAESDTAEQLSQGT